MNIKEQCVCAGSNTFVT